MGGGGGGRLTLLRWLCLRLACRPLVKQGRGGARIEVGEARRHLHRPRSPKPPGEGTSAERRPAQ